MSYEAAISNPKTRRHPRTERRGTRVRLAAQDIRGVYDSRLAFRLIDVAEGGLCVETDKPLPYDSGVTVQFQELGLSFKVRVAWTKLVQGGAAGPRYRTGLQFLSATFDQIRALLEAATH